MTAPHVRAGQMTTARVMRARWKTVWNKIDASPNPLDSWIAEEAQLWDELIDYIEANDLNETEVDPR